MRSSQVTSEKVVWKHSPRWHCLVKLRLSLSKESHKRSTSAMSSSWEQKKVKKLFNRKGVLNKVGNVHLSAWLGGLCPACFVLSFCSIHPAVHQRDSFPLYHSFLSTFFFHHFPFGLFSFIGIFLLVPPTLSLTKNVFFRSTFLIKNRFFCSTLFHSKVFFWRRLVEFLTEMVFFRFAFHDVLFEHWSILIYIFCAARFPFFRLPWIWRQSWPKLLFSAAV